jgi:hypothetical protein
MQCHKPYIPKGHPDVPAPCRGCPACNVNRKRLWTHRLILELKAHEKACFITLTYDDKHHPKDGSVSISEIQGFNKRLRKRLPPRSTKFYSVGEYGDRTWRPHYHLAYYGISCDFDGGCSSIKRKAIAKYVKEYGDCCEIPREIYWEKICPTCKKIEKSWNRGFIDVQVLNAQTAGYICGYVTKKMTKQDDERLDRGDNVYLHPEFSTQSKNIGWAGLQIVLDEWKQSPHFERFLTECGDIPYSLSHDGKSFPIGRHLRQKARAYLSLEEAYDENTGEIKYVSKEADKKIQKEKMQIMYEDHYNFTEEEKAQALKGYYPARVNLKRFMHDKNYQRNKNMEKRNNIFKKEKKL